MGAAYTRLANDGYAGTYNPAGLGFLNSTQFSGQHLSYIDTLHYEYLNCAVLLPRAPGSRIPAPGSGSTSSLEPGARSGVGGSVQYLGTGDVTGRDKDGNPTGSISGYYASYNLSYGRRLSDKLSLGLTGKLINAKLDSVSASAYAADLGGMYKPQRNLTLAATLTNLGSKLTFLNDGDSLPLAFHLGAAYQPTTHWLFTAEGVYPQTGLASFHVGGEWRPIEMISLRTGYRTDTTKGISVLDGFSTGLGMNLWGQELAYSWLPYGDLGNTHYASLLMKFGEAERAKRNLIQYQHIKLHRTANNNTPTEEITPDYQELMKLLTYEEKHLATQLPEPGTNK